MFGKASCPSRIYSYACKPPSENLDLVEEQIRLKHRYRNKRVEIVQAKLVEKDELMRRLSPQMADVSQKVKDLKEKIDALCEEQAAVNSKGKKRSRDEASKARRAEIRELKAQKAKLNEQLKQLRHNFYKNEANLSALAELDSKYVQMEKVARAETIESGIYWGNYLMAERAIPLSYKVSATKGPPQFSAYGKVRQFRVTVQIQNGWPVKYLVSNPHSQVWMTPCEDSNKHYNVHIRICKRDGEWKYVTLRTRTHRPLPEDGIVKDVSLVKRRVATHFKWFVQFVVAQKQGFETKCADHGVVDVKFAVKKLEACDSHDGGGVRVATWEGSDGESGEIVLPEGAYVSRRRKVEDLNSIRKKNFNEALSLLLEWKRENAKALPEWFADRTKSIHQWKAPARLAALVLEWRKQRMSCDKGIFNDMENWRKQDKHLYEWEGHQVLSACNFRKNMFRQIASDLSQKYKKVVVPKINVSEDKKKSGSDKEKDEKYKGQRWYMFIAAPGELRAILKERFAESESEEDAMPLELALA